MTDAQVTAGERAKHRMCGRKLGYRTKGKAIRVASSAHIQIKVYQCPHCELWHLSSLPKPLKAR